MEVVLALIIGLAVACVIFVLGRAFVGSGPAPDKLPTSDSAKIVDEATAAGAVSLLDHRDISEAPKKISEAPKKAAARSQEDAVKAPPRPRRRKARKATVPGPDVVQ
jgi:hypothetical protein